MLESFFEAPVYGLARPAKQELLSGKLKELTALHRGACSHYANILRSYDDSFHPGGEIAPFLPVSLFKLYHLSSVPDDQVFKTMTSSGTSGQQPSRIVLDSSTASMQTRALTRIVTSFVGQKRLPMLILDNPSTVKNRRTFSARGAGILGMMTFGRDHTFALEDETMAIDWDTIDRFAEKYPDQPIFAFGFTFMVWRYFLQQLEQSGRKLPFRNSILIHSGGWKKLEAEKVSNEIFRARAADLSGFDRVHNFYGMVEQTGSVFMECEAGHLHAPIFSDIIIRDPHNWDEMPNGAPGVIQVVSVLPHSYPGHSLLTEDRGVILGEDDCACGRMGKYFAVLGRLPKTEVRGCSDTFVGSN